MKILEKPDVDFDTMLTCINSAFDTLPQKQIELQEFEQIKASERAATEEAKAAEEAKASEEQK